MKPLVAYGSTMHQSENIAKQIASHFKVEAIELNKVTMDVLQNTKFAVFVIATFGNGMFPQNSKQFAEALSYSDVDLSNLQFAELALGSNHYQFFCKAGEELNQMLTDRGAKEIIPYVRSDKCDKDYGVSVIENFKRDVINLKTDKNGQLVAPKAESEPASKSTLPLIAFGSTMGGSAKIAKRIASEFGTEAIELNNVQLDVLEKSNFAIFVVSTFGDGELPDNAIEFAERLRSSSVNLSYLQFALLGLGSTKYKKFCYGAEEIHDLLTNHGAKDIIPYVKSDKKASDQGSSVIEKFVTDTCSISVPHSAPMNIYGDDLLIAYGSTMHSSEKIAKRIAENFGIEAVELNSISINQLGNAKLAVFVVATIGEGRYPKNCQEFADRLTSSNVNLNNLRYALLGLGSTYYKDFCKAAINVDKLLKGHGATPIFQLVKSNKASPDQGRSDIADFEKRVLQLKSVVDDNSSVKPLVAYGSTRHKAEKIAKAIAEQYETEAVELNNITENDLATSKICIIVISTINDGDFPQNSRDFCQKLCSGSTVDLRGVQYALLGLGSSYYEKFCRASEELNKAFIAHGAKPLIPYLKSDKATGDSGDGTINQFIDNLSKAMKSIQDPSSSKLELKEIGSVQKGQDANKMIVPEGFALVDIKSKELLSEEGYAPQLLCYTLKIPSSMTYKPGDYCLIRPQNDPQIVSDVISALSLNPDTIVEINGQGMNSGIWPNTVSVLQLFSQFIDLNAKPSQALYQLIGASNMNTSATVYELIINNTSSVPNLKDLLLAVTPIEPRTYSISSDRKGELTLTIGSVIVDENHPGLCTHYLTLPSTNKLVIDITKGSFGYPEDPTVPIILCGLGTGIAPLFSLIEHRENLIKSSGEKVKLGECLVFIGTRFVRASKKALEKLRDYENKKVITKFYEAISREGKKQHIQAKMKEVDDELWSVWKDERAIIYFCGPPNTAIDDMREIFTKLAQKKANLTRTDAVSHCSSRKWCIEEF